LRRILSVSVLTALFLLICISLVSQDRGSCEQYADILCEICGDDHKSCIEMQEKAAINKSHTLCDKAVKHLPSTYKNASDLNKSILKKALCEKKMPVTETAGPPGAR
jgi:hypothetical protein